MSIHIHQIKSSSMPCNIVERDEAALIFSKMHGKHGELSEHKRQNVRMMMMEEAGGVGLGLKMFYKCKYTYDFTAVSVE